MNPAFDKVASSYDQEFTDTPIGRAQRDRVWRYMRKVLGRYEQARILELNCGTGEDAVFLAELGHEVLATDISTEMLKRVEKKALAAGLEEKVRVQQLDLAAPVLEGEAGFDLIFSNFGGLNCLSFSQLKKLKTFLRAQLKPEGHCICVVMPPSTMIEKIFRWWRKELHVYHQRSSKKGLAIFVGDQQVHTFFYTISEVESAFKEYQTRKMFATGFIPSYLEKNRLLSLLLLFDKFACRFKLDPNKADHYLIHFFG